MQTTWRHFFLSPSGRFGRRQYWGATLALYGIGAVLAIPLFLDPDWVRRQGLEGAMFAYISAFLVACLALMVVHLVAIVKRFHDRGKSGVWCLVGFVPVIGGAWILIECGCLPGTPGPNAYGWPDRAADIVSRF